MRFAPAFLILVFAACGESLRPPVPTDSGVRADGGMIADASFDAAVPKDAGFDAGFDAGLPRPDAGPFMCRNQDAGAPPDLGPDPSLNGTSLENVSIVWREPLELCNEWREGQSFSEEQANKVHITLAPSPRRGLGQTTLDAARLDRGTIRRGLTADQIWILEDQPRSARLIEWTVREPAGNTLLVAAIEHDFGPAGVLSERLSVGRVRGTPSDVDYNQDLGGGEVSFWWRAANDPPDRGVLLGFCAGSSRSLEDALEVVAAGDATRSVTVLRKLRTSLALAGSAPVYLHAAQTVLSDRPGELFLASGPFSQIYAAEHHNWNEHSAIDYTSDAIIREMVLEPLSVGQPAGLPFYVENVDLVGLSSVGLPPAITVTTFDTTEMRRDRFSPDAAGRRWIRIDRTALVREHRAACANPNVGALGDYEGNTVVQLVTCPGNGALGFDVVAAVPVIFNGDPSQVGARISGAAITDQNGAVQIMIGAWSLRLTLSSPGVFDVVLRNPQGMQVFNALRSLEPFDLPLPADEAIEGQSADGEVTMSFVRRYAGQGAGQSSIFVPIRFSLGFGGCGQRVEGLDRMRYQSTHHNWNDQFIAESDSLIMTWRIGFDQNGMTEHHVSARQTVDGAEILPDTIVIVR